MKKNLLLFFSSLLLIYLPLLGQAQTTDDGRITVQFLQLNDVYEIAPLEHGTVGGMARVATIRSKLLAQNPNTYTLLSGDFVFPSAMGTIPFEGKPIKGRQMVEAMNAAGVDLVTFGNHEFDLKEGELKDRINESKFDWVCANTWNNTPAGNMPFTKLIRYSEEPVPRSRVLVFTDADGTTVRIGIFGICINSTAAGYVTYDDYKAAAQKALDDLKDRCDFTVAITHLSMEDDRKLAAAFPQIRLIFGGHEHIHSYDTVGTTLIAKADANARTVYVHQLGYDKKSKQLDIHSQLTAVDASIPEDPFTKSVVDKWIAIADKSLQEQGFDPDEVLATLEGSYDGRESSVRYTATNLTRLIAKAFSAAEKRSECSLYNSGGIRLDDELQGAITQYDIIRTLPYGGKIVLADLKGSLLRRLLDTSWKHQGNGCFLQYDRITKDKKGNWLINGKKLNDARVYRAAINDYLASGQQQFMEFMNDQNPAVIKLSPPDPGNKLCLDMRQAVISYLRQGGK